MALAVGAGLLARLTAAGRDKTGARQQEEKKAQQKKQEEQQKQDQEAEKKEQEQQNTTARTFLVRGIVAAFGLALVLVLLLDWKAFRYNGSPTGTLDAQLRGDPVMIAARVAGLVTKVGIDDYAVVRKGQLLYRIEPDTYVTAADSSRAQAAQAAAEVATLQAQIAEQEAAVASARATVSLSQVDALRSRRDRERQDALVGTAGELHRAWEQATAADIRDRAQVAASEALGGQEQARIDVLRTRLAAAEATLAQRRAALDNARITVGYTDVLAPEDGVLTERLAYLGQYVTAGRPLVTFISLRTVWAIGYYREEQLTFMQPGQRALVHVDAFPQYEITGRVDSIAPVAQARETTLPSERATGNFTKVVQRIPVKVSLDPTWLDPQPPAGGPPSLFGRLIPGLSVELRVFTSADPGQGGGAGGGTGAGRIVPGGDPAMPPPHAAPPGPPLPPALQQGSPPRLAPLRLPAAPGAGSAQPGRPGG